MMRRVLFPSTGTLALAIGVTALIALLGIASGVWAINQTQQQAARAEADKTRAEAVVESQCRIIDIYRIHPGDPMPDTERGVDLAKKFQQEWVKLRCR